MKIFKLASLACAAGILAEAFMLDGLVAEVNAVRSGECGGDN